MFFHSRSIKEQRTRNQKTSLMVTACDSFDPTRRRSEYTRIDVIIMASAGKSATATIQRVGRVLRLEKREKQKRLSWISRIAEKD